MWTAHEVCWLIAVHFGRLIRLKSSWHNAPMGNEASKSLTPTCALASASAIERLFREHNDSLLRFLANRLSSHQEAKEVAQEAYVRLLKLDSTDTVSYLRAFLFKTASNIATDRLRARGYQERLAPLNFFETVPDAGTPERAVSGTEQLAVLERLIAELPAKCKRALMLNRYYGMDIPAIARDLNTTERSVRRYIMQALVHCRAGLDDANGGAL